jgi:hypothetical protein
VSGFRADDRVLLLAAPTVAELAGLARVLMRGSVVVISTAEEIAAIGSQLAEFDNVMLLEASPEKIPWRDGGFTRILVPQHLERLLPYLSNELHRVLAPGGEIVRNFGSAQS